MTSSTPQIADYFVVVGLPDHPQHFQEFSSPESPTKRPTANLDPITDVTVIFKALGDPVPRGFECIEKTPAGLSANLNFGSFRAHEVYLCFRRGRDRPALTDMGVMFEGARLLENAAAVFQTPTGRIANVNNASSPCLYVTYSRSPPNATLDTLVVMDLCVINASKGEEPPHTFCRIDQKLNTGIVGADMYLCYRKARLRDHVLSFKPEVLSRYPLDDTAAPYPLNCNIPMFCMPLGASLEVWPVAARDPQPVFSSFVITHTQNDASESLDEKFIQYYGCVITFYESCTIEQLSSLQINRLGLSPDVPLKDQGKRIASSKAICLLSQYAFFSEFKQYLTHIYKMSFTENHRLPIERFISHLLHEVPVPSAERPRILAQLSPEESILFTRPEDLPLPPSCASFTSLLNDLGVEKTLDVFLYAILGQSMLVHSVRPSVLTLACEAIKTMIFPFIWSFPFIPFCPLALSEIVQCPMGFIIGVDTSYFDLYEPPPEVICIDLDTGNILLPHDKKNLTAAKLLPKKPAAQLQARLEKVYKTLQRMSALFSEVVDVSTDISHERQEMKRQRETALELECREAFLYFMATILRGYHAFLIVPTNVKTKTNLDVDSLFRIKDFVRTRDKSLAKFFELLNLGGLQNFAKFVEELTFSSKPQVFDFFNDCCRKVEDMMNNQTSPRTRLIECSRDFDNERTIVIPPPSSLGLEEGRHYSYSNFPLLEISLFLNRPRANSASGGCGELTNGISSGNGQGSRGGGHGGQSTATGRSGRQQFDWNIAKRTKQEMKSSMAVLDARASIPYEWAKIIEAHCYAVWFSVLPAFCRLVHSRRKLLSYAVSVARRWARFSDSLGNDQTPYRVIFALADVYRHPAVAVQLLMRIRKTNFELNAATLALCNKVLYQTSWQTESQSRPARLWRLLRDVVCAMARFRAAGFRHRSRSQQSLFSFSAASSDQPINVISGGALAVGVSNAATSSTLAVTNGFHNNGNNEGLIYSPRQKLSFGKFPDTPLISAQISVNASTLPSPLQPKQMMVTSPRLPADAESLSSLNANTYDFAAQSPSSTNSVYASPYIREKMGKVLDFLQTAASAKPTDFWMMPGRRTASTSSGQQQQQQQQLQPGRRLVESQSSVVIMNSGNNSSGAVGNLQRSDSHGGSSHSVVNSPVQQTQAAVAINIMSPGSDCSEFDQPRQPPLMSTQSSHQSGGESGGGLFKRILTRTVTGVLESPLGSSSGINESTTTTATTSSIMKESRSTPQLFLSSASNQLSSGFRQFGGKLRSAVAQIAAATVVVPDDSLIDLHTEASSAATGAAIYRQPSISSLSIRSQDDAINAPIIGQSFLASASKQQAADVVSIGSQVTSDSATNGSNANGNTAQSVQSATLGSFTGNPQSSSISSKTRPATGSVSYFDADAPSHHQNSNNRNRSNHQVQDQPGSTHDSMTEEARRDDIDDLDFWPLPASRDECSVQIVLCAANKCPSPKCGQILFEEDIMAMWSASDSVYNAVCPMCGHRFIPKLEVYLKDFRRSSNNNEDALKKEQNGDSSFTTDDFVGCAESWGRLRRCQSEILTKWSASELVRNADADGMLLAKRPFRLVGPISTILFLSPLALRKEIEQATERNNNATNMFADSSFVENHEMIYWNLLFVFARMHFHSHLPSLVMFSRVLNGGGKSNKTHVPVSELREAASQVNVLVVWDNLALYPILDRPLYWHWVTFGNAYPVVDALVDYRPFSRRLMSKLLTSIRRSDMLNAIKLVLLIRRRGLPNELFFRNYSMYRILLNLCIVALGRYNIDLKAFDRAYYSIFSQIKSTAASSGAALRAAGRQPLSNEMRSFDQPPSEAAMFCRRAFNHADIYHDFDQRPNFAVSFSVKPSMAVAAATAAPLTNGHDDQPQPSQDLSAAAAEEVVVVAEEQGQSSSTLAEVVDSSVVVETTMVDEETTAIEQEAVDEATA